MTALGYHKHTRRILAALRAGYQILHWSDFRDIPRRSFDAAAFRCGLVRNGWGQFIPGPRTYAALEKYIAAVAVRGTP